MSETTDQKQRDILNDKPDWNESTEQLLLYVEDDAARWEDAARECEHAARTDTPAKAPTWHLLSAVYREHARNHRDLVLRMRSRSAAA